MLTLYIFIWLPWLVSQVSGVRKKAKPKPSESDSAAAPRSHPRSSSRLTSRGIAPVRFEPPPSGSSAVRSNTTPSAASASEFHIHASSAGSGGTGSAVRIHEFPEETSAASGGTGSSESHNHIHEFSAGSNANANANATTAPSVSDSDFPAARTEEFRRLFPGAVLGPPGDRSNAANITIQGLFRDHEGPFLVAVHRHRGILVRDNGVWAWCRPNTPPRGGFRPDAPRSELVTIHEYDDYGNWIHTLTAQEVNSINLGPSDSENEDDDDEKRGVTVTGVRRK